MDDGRATIGMSSSLGLNIEPREDRMKRHEERMRRIESSWEDVSDSDEDDDEEQQWSQADTSIASSQEGMTTSHTSTPATTELDDQWEDEGSESDSGLSSATEAAAKTSPLSGVRGVDNRDEEDVSFRSTPQRSDRVPRRNSAQRALREYKKSKLALMQTESNQYARLQSVLSGEHLDQYENDGLLSAPGNFQQDDGKELKRTDTMDVLGKVEPFTLGVRSESYDEAQDASRAYDIRLQSQADEGETDGRRSASHSRRTSAAGLYGRSPRLQARRISTSPSAKLMQLPNGHGISASASPTQENGEYGGKPMHIQLPQRERYASDPNTPVEMSLSQADLIPDALVSSSPRIVLHKDSNPTLSVDNSHHGQRHGTETPRRASNVSNGAEKKDDKRDGNAETAPPSRQNEQIPSAESISAQLDQLADAAPMFSLWDYLKEEIMASDFDSTQEMKWERVTNFIAIPFWMEKIMLFGFFVCLDSFLYTFTILPLRFLVAVTIAARNLLLWLAGGPRRYLSSSHKCDILKTLLIVMSCYILSRITDASQMYHSVRGQDVVKLYVIFNVLEIADRLCCSFGQDLLDSLFSRSTLARRKDGQQPYLRPLGFFALSLLYVLAHTLVLLYQLVTLNVAINSYDNALLTLLLSNQFVEIKGSVFKKFEKENLFQLTCADIVERFQLTLMLCSIGMRNLIEVTGAMTSSTAATAAGSTPSGELPIASILPTDGLADVQQAVGSAKTSLPMSAIAMLGPLPASFTVLPSFSLLETIFTPVLIVLASEYLVDWLKHAFITKFNHIRPSVYGRFMDVLCRDLTLAGPVRASGRRRHTFVDQSPVVSRRLGFASVPLACLLVRMTSQIMAMLRDDSQFDECVIPDLPVNEGTDPASAGFLQGAISIVLAIVRKPILAMLRPCVHDPNKTLDVFVLFIWRASTWVLTVTIAWVFLVGIKLLLGTNLSSFAAQRYATMAQREKEEELNARGRQPIGVDKEEMAYDAKIAQLVDRSEDDALRMGLNGQTLPTPAAPKAKNTKVDSLMDVSRYTMVRSRIW